MPDIEFPYSSLGGTKIPLIPIRLHLPHEVLKIADVGFSEKMKIAFNILGRKDIFETFKICFNDKTAKLTFHEL